MREILFSLYNIVIFSLYFGLVDIGDKLSASIVITYIMLLYLFFMGFIYLNMYQTWFKYENNIDRLSFYSWLFCYYIIVMIFLFENYNFISINTMMWSLITIWLVVWLMSIMTSFYIIMNESKYWYSNLFPSVVIFWILFHYSKEAIFIHSSSIIAVPIICIYILKIVHFIESKKNKNILAGSTFIFICLITIEIMLYMNEISCLLYYILLGLFIILDMLWENVESAVTFLISPFILPPIILWVLYKKKKDKETTVNEIIHTINTYFTDRILKKDGVGAMEMISNPMKLDNDIL